LASGKLSFRECDERPVWLESGSEVDTFSAGPLRRRGACDLPLGAKPIVNVARRTGLDKFEELDFEGSLRLSTSIAVGLC
jgi:hypothetical protein